MAVSAFGHLDVQRFTDVELNSTPELLLSGTPTAYGLEVDNTQNKEPVYVKVWDQTSVTVGTTAPDFVFKVPAGKKRKQPLDSASTGHAFGTGLSVGCVLTPGTPGSDSPTNPVIAEVLTN